MEDVYRRYEKVYNREDVYRCIEDVYREDLYSKKKI